MTYSNDFMTHILSVKKEENLSFRATAKRFKVAVRSIQKWEKGELPKRTRKPTPTKICPEKLKQDVIDHPDDFQYERAERFGVTPRGIGYALEKLKITRKKRLMNIQKQTKTKEKNSG